MAPFNPFPVGYQPYNPYQAYQAQQAAQMQQAAPQIQQQTKYVEVIPVDTAQEAEACPMAAGSSFMFFARDDSFIAVKSIGVNGQQAFTIYDKRPPAPSVPAFNPGDYVTKDELENRLSAILGSTQRADKRTVKKEEIAE